MAFRKAGENFDLVAVSSFEGSCAADVSAGSASDDNIASLADTSIADGRILPFFRVDCSRLVRMLGTQSEPVIIGRALARIIGHEIYHIVAQTSVHHETGLAKASFSIRDLTGYPFDLNALSIERIRISLTPLQTSSFLSPRR